MSSDVVKGLRFIKNYPFITNVKCSANTATLYQHLTGVDKREQIGSYENQFRAE